MKSLSFFVTELSKNTSFPSNVQEEIVLSNKSASCSESEMLFFRLELERIDIRRKCKCQKWQNLCIYFQFAPNLT